MKQRDRLTKLFSVKRKALPVLRKHRVKRAAIFGSVARGTSSRKSDVDFLIEYCDENRTLFDLVDLKDALEKALGGKVDIVTYRSIDSKLRERILAEQIPIL